jgi:predicted transcriptional regulator
VSEWKIFLAEQLQDPEVRTEWDALEPEFTIIQAIIDARKNTGLTQKQLSERTGIAQGDISRLENGNANPSLKTLKRLAAAMDMTLKIEFTPSVRSV